MQAINHALTGAVIGLAIDEPLIALPVAFGSHFALDAIPHFGLDVPKETYLASKTLKVLLIADATLCFLLVLLLFVTKPKNWLQACLCAFLAASPDFMWMPKYIRQLRHKKPKSPNRIMRFHSSIQWFQHPIGVVPEIVWFVGMSLVLLTFLHPA